MFVVCFGDGLGNQMFQYAFYLALQNNYPENTIQMDIFRIYGNYIHNGYELERVFNIKPNNCSWRTAFILSDYFPRFLKRYRFFNILHTIRRYFWGKKECFITQDDPTSYYDEVFNLSTLKSYMFCGNWVNPRYFSKVSKKLLEEFTFPPICEAYNIAYQKKILATESIAVHIRKGDYLSSKMLNLNIKYYERAKSIIDKSITNPTYFIFTDDKDNIKEYFPLFNEGTIVEGNSGNQNFRDMQLMSLCKHNIIANSTFSFWGAYLNANTSKIVIAPSRAKYDFRHPFACNDWILIDVDG